MKITIYTIKDCAFSKQEKEYFNTNKLVFEERDLEANKSFLTEMLAISNNFAGTPVTRVEKDDGTISVLKGFTKEEFDTTFGFAAAPTIGSGNPIPTDLTDSTDSTVPPVETLPPAPVPTDIPPAETPVTVAPDPLKSVMEDLQTKSEPAQTVPSVEQPLTTPPTVDSTIPTIPDFPAK